MPVVDPDVYTDGPHHYRRKPKKMETIDSVSMVCPECKERIYTRVIYMPSCRTHFIAVLFCLTVAFLPCVLLPYYVNLCNDAKHFCPKCDVYIGTKTPAVSDSPCREWFCYFCPEDIAMSSAHSNCECET